MGQFNVCLVGNKTILITQYKC